MLSWIWRPKKNGDLVVVLSNTKPGSEWTYIEYLSSSAFYTARQKQNLKRTKERNREKKNRYLMMAMPERRRARGNPAGDWSERGRGKRSSGCRRRAPPRGRQGTAISSRCRSARACTPAPTTTGWAAGPTRASGEKLSSSSPSSGRRTQPPTISSPPPPPRVAANGFRLRGQICNGNGILLPHVAVASCNKYIRGQICNGSASNLTNQVGSGSWSQTTTCTSRNKISFLFL